MINSFLSFLAFFSLVFLLYLYIYVILTGLIELLGHLIRESTREAIEDHERNSYLRRITANSNAKSDTSA